MSESASKRDRDGATVSTRMRLSEINRYHDRTRPMPLAPVRLDDSGPTIWCQLEFPNPSGSTKDRIATQILSKALRRGEIQQGGIVVEASSGLDEHRNGAGRCPAWPHSVRRDHAHPPGDGQHGTERDRRPPLHFQFGS